MFTTPQDLFKSFPKNEKEIREVTEKVKSVFLTETEKATSTLNVYRKALTGDATINEIHDANKKAEELFVSARFAAFVSIPGAIFAVPTIAKVAKEYNVPFVPDSVAKEFNL